MEPQEPETPDWQSMADAFDDSPSESLNEKGAPVFDSDQEQAEDEKIVRVWQRPSQHSDLMEGDWIGGWLGTTAALALYIGLPMLVAGVFFLMDGGVSLILYALIMAMPLLVLLSVSVGIVFMAVKVVYESLFPRASEIAFSAFAGGLTGFFFTMPYLLQLLGKHSPDYAFIALWALVGPCLATLLGQIGGAWGVVWWSNPVKKQQAEPVQFGLRQLFALTFWVAIASMVIRLTGYSDWKLGVILPLWATYQSATLWMVRLWMGELGPRSTQRQFPQIDFELE